MTEQKFASVTGIEQSSLQKFDSVTSPRKGGPAAADPRRRRRTHGGDPERARACGGGDPRWRSGRSGSGVSGPRAAAAKWGLGGLTLAALGRAGRGLSLGPAQPGLGFQPVHLKIPSKNVLFLKKTILILGQIPSYFSYFMIFFLI